jgi:nucleotide-binding universal stress UspA family protein
MRRTIIAGIDGSERSRDAVALGRTLARRLDAGLTLVCAYPYQPIPFQIEVPEYGAELRRRATEHLERAADLLAGVSPVRTRAIGCLSPARAIQIAAEESAAAAIVVGSSRHGGIGRVLSGTVTDRLLNGSPCPVAVAPAGYWGHTDQRLRRIGVAYDGSAESALALDAASDIAGRGETTLELIHVLDPAHGTVSRVAGGIGYQEILARHERADVDREAAEEHLAGVVAQLPDPDVASFRVVVGDPTRVLAEASEELDLLVCGSRGYGPLHSVLVGGLSGRLIRCAACPVLVTPRGLPKRASDLAEIGAAVGAGR